MCQPQGGGGGAEGLSLWSVPSVWWLFNAVSLAAPRRGFLVLLLVGAVWSVGLRWSPALLVSLVWCGPCSLDFCAGSVSVVWVLLWVVRQRCVSPVPGGDMVTHVDWPNLKRHFRPKIHPNYKYVDPSIRPSVCLSVCLAERIPVPVQSGGNQADRQTVSRQRDRQATR